MEGTVLVHHGILGQKWGIRRYQNPDGTLTEEGKKRYYVAKDGSLKETDEYRKKKIIRNVAIGVGATATVAAAAIAYANNKETVDNFVGNFFDKTKQRILEAQAKQAVKELNNKYAKEAASRAKEEAIRAFVEKNKSDILRDPGATAKYAKFLTDGEISSAIRYSSQIVSLKKNKADQIASGAKYINAIMENGKAFVNVGTTVSNAYDLKNRQAFKDANQYISERNRKED